MDQAEFIAQRDKRADIYTEAVVVVVLVTDWCLYPVDRWQS